MRREERGEKKGERRKTNFTTETQRAQRVMDWVVAEYSGVGYGADLTRRIIGAAIEVHRELGPGLLESAYQRCLMHELGLQNLPFESEVPIPLRYKGEELDCSYRIDLLIDREVVVELKAVETILPVHHAQLLTYMKLIHCPIGLLINFNVPLLRDGIKRFLL